MKLIQGVLNYMTPLNRFLISFYLLVSLITVGFVGLIFFEEKIDDVSVLAETFYVDINGNGNFTSIQDAINNASSGSTIYIWAGTYYENLKVNKTITIIGNGTDNTTINGSFKGSVIYVSSDFVNISGITVTGSNQTWTDLHAGIKIDNANNATIKDTNCSDNIVGIYLNNSHSNIIKNNSCSNIWSGIYCSLSNSNTFENNTCDLNDQSGIGLSNANSNVIKYNSFNSNSQSDLEIYGSDFNTISNNNFESSIIGIGIYYSKSNTVINNKIASMLWGIQLDESEGIILKNNEMGFSGINLAGAQLKHWNTHSIDTSNTVNGKQVYYWRNKVSGKIPQDAGQVILVNCQNVVVENQNFKSVNYGLQMAFSNNNIIRNNLYSLTLWGIFLFNSNSNSLLNNTCNTSSEGIHFSNSNSNTITNSTCVDNWYGMSFYNSDFNTITYCNLSGNSNGISLEDSSLNTLTNNIFLFNSFQGLILAYADNNMIYHNNFLANDIQALYVGTGTNQWDNGHGEGNYWDDYTGLDNGADGRVRGDGVGDTKLPHLALDNYPFINHSGWLYPGLPYIYDPGEFDSDGNYIVKWRDTARTTYYDLLEAKDITFQTSPISYKCTSSNIKIEGKQNGTYYYCIRACNNDYISVWSNIVEIIVDYPPKIPKNLKVSIYPGGNTLNLTWDPNLMDTKEYEIQYKSEDMSSWESLATIDNSSCVYNHTKLTDGVKYYYRIRGMDNRGQYSSYSDEVSAIPMDSIPPNSPMDFRVISTTVNSITLDWQANRESDLAGYNIYRSNTSNPIDWGKPIDSINIGKEKFIDDGLQEFTTYYYVITAFDEVPNESGHSIVVNATTLLGPHGPEINNSIPDFTIPEDGYDNSSIKLYHWFKDINGDELLFRCKGQDNIDVTIFQENGTVILVPMANWNGQETLTFYASDDDSQISDDVTVTVTPLNDPPGPAEILAPKDEYEVKSGTPITFKAQCEDVDLKYGDVLMFKWISNISGEFGTGETLQDVILTTGHHLITLEVTDSFGEISNATLKVSILSDKIVDIEEPIPEDDKGSGDNSDSTMIIAGAGGTIIILIILIILLWLFIFKKTVKDKKIEETSPQQLSTPLRDDSSKNLIAQPPVQSPPMDHPEENSNTYEKLEN